MKITILNPNTVKELYKNHGEFARICYNTSPGHEESVGRHCAKSGHMSGSRAEYIKFLIEDISRGTAEQIMRHEIGTFCPPNEMDNWSFSNRLETWTDINPNNMVKNCLSFRYVDESGFKYYTPSIIKNNPDAYAIYKKTMTQLDDARSRIRDILLEDGEDKNKVNEEVNALLPRATTTSLCLGLTPEALIQFCHKRLCVRAQEEIRNVAKAMKQAITEYCPSLAEELVPQCDFLLYCPENKGCGRAPSKEAVRAMLKQQKKGEA